LRVRARGSTLVLYPLADDGDGRSANTVDEGTEGLRRERGVLRWMGDVACVAERYGGGQTFEWR
jgi:hypothetical protein